MKSRGNETDTHDVDLTPMLDVVFILLIFFVVTASFIKESGIDIDMPQGNPPASNEIKPLVFTIDSNQDIWFEKRLVNPGSARAIIENARAGAGVKSVMIIANKTVAADTYSAIADAAREANIRQVSMHVLNEQSGKEE